MSGELDPRDGMRSPTKALTLEERRGDELLLLYTIERYARAHAWKLVEQTLRELDALRRRWR